MKGKKLLSLTLSAVMAVSMAAPAYAAPQVRAAEGNPLSLQNVKSIQAITEGTYYGTGVTAVEITYNDGVDVSGASAASYELTDRGSLTADFGAVDIADVKVEGQVVTLEVKLDSDATEANKLIYTGADKEGNRQRDSYGVYVSGAWYRDAEGVIHNGAGDEEKGYVANETKMGYQARECLELRLQVAGEDAIECLADEKGQYNAEGKWLETIDTQFGEGKFQKLTDLQIPSTAATANWEGTGSAAADFVDGYYYVPENYDPANGIVFTLQGQGISYWKLPDGSDNAGTGVMFDCATVSWANKGAIVVNIHDRSSQQTLAEEYDFVVDDANVMKYFLDTYKVTGNVVLQGNSRGTMASDVVIKALAGCAYNPKEQAMGWQGELDKKLDKSVYDFTIDTYICQNGSMGSTYWPEDVMKTIAATGLKVWAFDGEQDSNNIDTIAAYKAACAEVGYDDAWIAENVRLTGLTSNLTYYWGESDHSATRTNGWYFANAPYYGPYLHLEDGVIVYDQKLNDGDTYVLEGRGTAGENNKKGYEYTVYDDVFQVWAFEKAGKPADDGIVSLDEIPVPELDNSVPNRLPMTGYFKKTVGEGRTMKVYLADGIHVRDYYTIIAVPNGVNTEEFLTEQGWFAVADKNHEGLIVLEPGKAGWGSAEEEDAYVKAAIGFYSGNGYFSVFGENYLVGYGAGAPALERWAAANPLKVIAQVYVDSEGVDAEYLAATGAIEFGLKNGTYNQVTLPEGVRKLTNADAVVPTWFVGAAPEASLEYWKSVNDIKKQVETDPVLGTVYEQRKSSENWTTDYTGAISKVAVAEKADTAAICDFMYYYTRYENAFVYGNQLSVRASFDNAEFYTVEVNGHPREYYVYTPENVMAKAPVVVVWPGNTQTDRVFADATQWHEVADAEGFILVMMCEDYNTSTAVTHKDSAEFQQAMIAKVKADYAGKIDETRIYGSGQSLGSMTSQGFAATNPEFYAAVASTSGPLMLSAEEDRTYKAFPTYMIYGMGDLDMLEGNPWDDIDNLLDDWMQYMLKANKLDFAAVGENDYTEVALDQFGHKNLHVWTWTKTVDGVEVPMVQLAENMVRSHNCISAEMPELWDYMKHFSMDKKGTRYYSASAFAEDDAVVIADDITSLDEIPVPELDNSVPNRLPMTGYFKKSVADGRTMKVYLADGIHVRDYYTIIAVPNGVNTEDFLTEQGWFDVADKNHEGLIVLEPGKKGWGTAEEEDAYVKAAIGFYSGNGYFSVYGENYLVGYGAGAPALERWAAANPLKVIAQVYVDSEGVDAEYLAATGAIEFGTKNGAYNNVELPEDFKKLVNKDAVVPTWYVGNAPEASLKYWMEANDVDEKAVADAKFGQVCAQKADSQNWTTDYSGPISKVAVAEKADTAAICDFMYYYTRYENAFVYGNQLSVRTSFENAEFKTVEVNGHPREYYVYTPEKMMENAPVVVVWPGNTQTDRVFADATQWHDVAEAEGFMLVMMCEDYNTSTAVTHKDSAEFQEAMIAQVKADYAGKIDETRIYGSGQSLGSMTSQGFAATNPEFYAAVASTSGPLMLSAEEDRTYMPFPTYMIYGMGDLDMLEGNPWDGIDNLLDDWMQYMLKANDLDFAAVGENDYTEVALDQFGHKNLHVWTWNKTVDGVEVPMVQLAENMVRSHNCISAEMPELWDYMKHFCMTADGTRYYSASAFAEDDAVVIYEKPELQAKVVDIKATVAPNFYGHKVCQAVITFADDVRAYELEAAEINVWDRGSANPDFGMLKVVDKKIEGNVVTLTFNTDSDKTADRARNSFGMMNTTGWYQDSEGNIYFGSTDSVDNMGNKIYANKNNKTCQPRTPELRVTVDTELKDSIAPKCDLEITGGLEKIQTILVPVSAFQGGFSQVTDKEEVPVQVIFPDNYDKTKKYPAIVYQCGGGVNYWQLDAGVQNNIAPANNLGCNTVYDNTMTQWHKAMPEAIIMAVNVQSAPTEVSARQICDAIEYAAANWGVEIGKVVMSGNSQGTIIGSDAIRQRPDLFAAFIECNGNFGAMIGTPAGQDGTVENSSFKNWTAAEVANMIDNDVACWMFNGETDGANPGVAQDTYETLANLYAAKGYSAEWIFNNIRVSGLQSWKFKAYGETDHSVTKVVADQYVLNPYYDVYENATMKPGQKYKFTGKEDYNFYEYTMDFDYTVYEESVSEWVQNLFAGKYAEEIKAPVKAEQTIVTAANASAITKVYGAKAFNLGAKTTGDGKITYKSSNTKVAKVDKNGKVTIKGTGKAVITITAAETENCAAATLKVTIKVVPKKGAVASAKVSKKSVTVKAKKDAQATGYQIQVSSSINFAKKATCTYTGKKVSTTVKNLKAGTYYVRTRSYKTVGSKKYYGAYSAVKVVVVK